MTTFYITTSELKYGGDSEYHLKVFTDKDLADDFCDTLQNKYDMDIYEQSLEYANDTIYIVVPNRAYANGLKIFASNKEALEYIHNSIMYNTKKINLNTCAYVIEYNVSKKPII